MKSSLRDLAGKVVPKQVRRRLKAPAVPWVMTAESSATPVPLDRFGLYAIVGTWMEADIIADTVANAFTQGADRVFLVDNDSPDETVARAVGAGAEHVLTYKTERFEEQHRYNLMNELVRHISIVSELDHIWWLWLDADEFPRPESGGTVREFIDRLDRQYRVVGARFINHFPTPGSPAHVPGDHPIDHQPMCEELPYGICDRNHRKHPLQRWDRGGPRIDAGLGFHRAQCDDRPLIEPSEPLVIHHFPFREEAVTRDRLRMLWSGSNGSASRAKQGDIATDHMEARLDSIDAVYAGDWEAVRNFMPGTAERGVELVEWTDLVPTMSGDIHRWPGS